MDRAKSLYVSIHGSENGFEAAFSPGTNVANMTAEQLMERLSFSTPFQVDDHLKPPEFYSQKLSDTFEKMLGECIIETVDNGEFDTCASKLLECLDMQDDIAYTRPPALVLERCRRGGKTFMLSAVGATLAQRLIKEKRSVYVVQISLNANTPLQASETAVNAIYSRIAYFIANPAGEFHIFRKKYSTFDSIREWLYINEVILLVDELNAIPNNATGYDDICFQLDTHVSKKGGALLYSTHHRIENDLLPGRQLGSASKLSLRKHLWMKIPRIDTENSFQATEIIHVHQKHKDIASLVGEVERAFPRSTSGRVLHVVAIPLYDQFPKYDFFLLHRGRYRG